MSIDISIVLNLHNELPYLRRTLASLEEAVDFARWRKLRIEIVVVLDRAASSVADWVNAYDFHHFDNHIIINVDNGSLGLSRNDGIAASSGVFIATADGDDLISYNTYTASYDAAIKDPYSTVVIPEYVFSFGNRHYFQRYMGSDDILKLMAFGCNPFTSRILCHRSILEVIPYIDARGGLKAFEDWHFNCEALIAGYRFKVAPNTLLFYRQRSNSIMTGAAGLIIPPSNYFDPERFASLCSADYKYLNGKKWLDAPSMLDLRDEVIDSGVLLELIASANSIDPMIDRDQMGLSSPGCNRYGPMSMGAAYFEACRIIAEAKFTDVVLLPYLSTGGGEKYIVEVLRGLSEIDGNRKFLVLSGEKFSEHAGLEKLPQGSMFIDLYKICAEWDITDIPILTLRLIQSTAPRAMIHVKSSGFAFDFIGKYSSELSGNKIAFYYFSDHLSCSHGIKFTQGINFNFISDHHAIITHIISDHRRVLEYATRRLELQEKSVRTLYVRCNHEDGQRARTVSAVPSKRLLWASRLDPEKRPRLIGMIAAAIAEDHPDVSIDVFGSSVYGNVTEDIFVGSPNVYYRGAFSRFSELNSTDYDALIYTSARDGLPNIILEAMSEGLLVVAPDVGGISEAVNSTTGILIENNTDDSILVRAYADAISSLYKGEIDVDALRSNATALLMSRHSSDAFLKELGEIFDIHP